MTLLKLAIKSGFNRKASVLLTLCTIAISVMLLLSIERVRHDAKSSFSNTISGTDLIVGARTGDIQLLLSSVFRIGHTNNAVSWQSYLDIKEKKGVAWTIPISLGDSHKGHAVLGTDDAYFTHYRYGKKQHLVFDHGRAFQNGQEVVLGSEVARKLHYHIGQKIIISHGMGNTSFHHHDDNPMTIVGILAPTGTPIDKTLHIPLIAVEAIHKPNHTQPVNTDKKPAQNTHTEHQHSNTHHHEKHHGEDHDEHHIDHSDHLHNKLDLKPDDLVGSPQKITAFLMGFDSPLYALQIRRNINMYKAEPLLAIMPGLTLRALWEMLDIVEKILLLFSIVVVLVSLLGMLTTLLATLSQRRRELAILRSVGARPVHIFALMSSEAILITMIGCVAGCILFYGLMFISNPLLQSQFGISLTISWLSNYELMLIGAIMAAGALMGLLPAAKAYFYSLADGMSIKI
jgi:putative ABC transport system permease protein